MEILKTPARPRMTRWEILPIILIVTGILCSALATRRVEAVRQSAVRADAMMSDEALALDAKQTARLVPSAFRGLIADWYWMRSLQYIGGKMVAHGGQVNLDDLSELNLKLIVPLLETTVKLDPQFLSAYDYIATVLPTVSPQAAIDLTEDGARNNPNSWRLLQHLGYIHWQQQNFKAAGAAYARGAEIEGAPAWMRAMEARMQAEGGSRDTAREIYKQMLNEADDEQLKEMAARRLLWLRSLDERDGLHRLLIGYKEARGTCPSSWMEIKSTLTRTGFKFDAQGAPLDPSGTPYRLIDGGCASDLNPQSKIPYK